MSKLKNVFLVGVIGGFVGYACGAAFTPNVATAQAYDPDKAGALRSPSSPALASHSALEAALAAAARAPCAQWEVKLGAKRFVYSDDPTPVEEGWEPFAYDPGMGNAVVRRCARFAAP
jgi:hypothetical protein